MSQLRRVTLTSLLFLVPSCGVDDRSLAQSMLETAKSEPPRIIETSELDALPAPVRRYLSRSSVVGKQHLRALRARGRGRIIMKGDWRPITFEQYDTSSGRSYLIESSMGAVISMTGHDSYRDGRGRMSIRLNELHFQESVGPEMDRSAMVTLLSELVGVPTAFARIDWSPIDERSALASFTDGEATVSGVCTFDDAGDLAGFTSDDRYQSQDDGSQKRKRWSAPALEIGEFGGQRVWVRAAGVWHEESGPQQYVEVRYEQLEQDVFETY